MTAKDQFSTSVLQIRRGSALELDIRAAWIATSQGGSIYRSNCLSSGTSSQPLIAQRSLLKPIQILANAQKISKDLSPEFLAMCVSSHSGEEFQIHVLLNLRQALNLEDTKLNLLKPSWPMDIEAQWRARQKFKNSQKIFHPCYAKHLIATSIGADFQSNVESFIRNLGVTRSIAWETDSCGLKTPLLTPIETCLLWQGWTEMDATNPFASSIIASWKNSPHLVGGTHRLDSWITKHSNGALLAKEGADGLLIVHDVSAKIDSQTLRTFFIKLYTGHNPAHLMLSTLNILKNIKQDLSPGLAKLAGVKIQDLPSNFCLPTDVCAHLDF